VITDEEQMLISAVRYALGRMTYVVGDTCNFVAKVKDKLSYQCEDIIIRDIVDEMERYHCAGYTLGMECDERRWKDLLALLKGESNEIR
jgi:hypothetical protein